MSAVVPPARSRRRLVFPLAVTFAVLVAAAVAALAAPRTAAGDLDPDSGAPGGSRAVARILARQGVEVTRARAAADVAADVGTLVVVHPELVRPGDLAGLAGRAARTVLVEPDGTALDAVAAGVRPEGSEPARTTTPRCSLPAAVGPARAGGLVYSVSPAAASPGQPSGATVCYPPDPGRPGTGSLVALPGGLVVLGQADVLRNEYLDQDANAALALRLLGSTARLTWLLPDPLRAADAAPASLRDLLPPAVGWTAAQLAVAVLLVLLWRARRLGPVVREPLPVVVRSTETLSGRARLYRRARATGRAAATLRTGLLRRLAARLAVPPDAGPDAVAVRAAQAAGLDAARVRAVLLGPPPPDERALVVLAGELDDLERAVLAAASPVRNREADR